MIEKWIRNQKGIGTLEMLMILAVLVTIALIFREWVFNWVGDILKDVKPTQSMPVHYFPTPNP